MFKDRSVEVIRGHGEWPKRERRKSAALDVQWAKVGGQSLEVGPSDAFLSEQYRDIFVAGETRAIYAAGCTGLGRLARVLGMPLYKTSTTGEGSLNRRIGEIRRDRYGAYAFVNEKWLDEIGWDDWFASHLYATQLSSPNSPVRVGIRDILVTLPASLAPEDFDALFDAEVRKGAVDAWAQSDDARRHCEFLRLDQKTLIRHTLYPGGRFSPAREITGFSIYSGTDRLVAIAEGAILLHLGLKR